MSRSEDFHPHQRTGTPRASDSLPSAQDDPQLIDALEEYQAVLEAGQRPDRQAFLTRHEDIAPDLARALDALDFIRTAAPQFPEPADDQRAGEVQPEGPLGDYRIVREIGRGGMGVVYEAVQISLGRQVALKVLPFAATLDARRLQRFKNEAQAAAHLHHTNIVPVYGVGCERGVHYYAMQLIDGKTLAAMIRDLRQLAGLAPPDQPGTAGRLAGAPASERSAPGNRSNRADEATGPYTPAPLPQDGPTAEKTRSVVARSTEPSASSPAFFRTAAHLGVQAAEALEHAHQLGVIHRDIKPANLLVETTSPLSPCGKGVAGEGALAPLSPRGREVGGEGFRLWITDFGLAHCQSQEGLTMTGDLMGTLRYMSPEQALARRVGVDHRTDIYSLGMTLYELLTLRPAFAAQDRQELLRQIASEEPRPLRQMNRSIPAELETIVLKAVEKNPAERYATAQELADDLRRFLEDRPIRAKRPTLLQRAKKWGRRHRPIVWSAAVSLAALLAMALVALAVSNRAITREKDLAVEAQRRAEGAERLAKCHLFDARLAQARASRWSRQVGQRFDSLQALTEAAQIARELDLGEPRLLEVRNEAIACLALPDVQRVKEWEGFPAGSSSGFAFDARLEHYARSDSKGTISVRRIADDSVAALLPGPGNSGADTMMFSPDGIFLAVGYWQPLPGKRTNFQVWDWRRRAVVLEAPSPVGPPAQFSADGRRMAVGRDDGTVLYDTAAWKEVKRLGPYSRPGFLAFDPDGARLAISGVNVHDVEVREVATGNLLRKLGHPARAEQLAWDPDGGLLAVACNDTQVYLWDVVAGRQHAVLRGHNNNGIGVTFSPGGDLLLSWAWDGTLRFWDPWTGRQMLTLAGSHGSFSQDGRRLALLNAARASIWEVAPGQEFRTLPAPAGASGRKYVRGGISPDGRWLAAGTEDGGVQFWDLPRGRPSGFLPLGPTHAATFHPTRSELFTAGRSGCYRCPFRLEAGSFRVGPPVRLLAPGRLETVATDAEGRLLAVGQWSVGGGVVVLDLDKPPGQARHCPHANTLSVAISPDSKWVASGTHSGFGVKVWEAHTGRLECRLLPETRYATVLFSPDGRWLVTGTDEEFCIWEVGSWQLVRRMRGLRGDTAFTPDTRIFAHQVSRGVVRLVDPKADREFALLQGPTTDMLEWLHFSPDGGQLLAHTVGTGHIQVWNLRAVRAQLRDLDLDWDLPPCPPPIHSAGVPSVQFEPNPAEGR
jgi:serine/threonine protein kinase/WD40 repeat protein